MSVIVNTVLRRHTILLPSLILLSSIAPKTSEASKHRTLPVASPLYPCCLSLPAFLCISFYLLIILFMHVLVLY